MSVEELLKEVTPHTRWHIVMRPFNADVELLTGQVVDTTSWAHTKVLIDNRYLRELPYGVLVPEPFIDELGIERRMLTRESAPPVLADVSERPTPTRKK